MSKNVQLNNTTYSGIETVTLPLEGGGTATFTDSDNLVITLGANSNITVLNTATSIGNYVSNPTTNTLVAIKIY